MDSAEESAAVATAALVVAALVATCSEWVVAVAIAACSVAADAHSSRPVGTLSLVAVVLCIHWRVRVGLAPAVDLPCCENEQTRTALVMMTKMALVVMMKAVVCVVASSERVHSLVVQKSHCAVSDWRPPWLSSSDWEEILMHQRVLVLERIP